MLLDLRALLPPKRPLSSPFVSAEAKMLEAILGFSLSLTFSMQSTRKFFQLYLQDRSILNKVFSGGMLRMDGIRNDYNICHRLCLRKKE